MEKRLLTHAMCTYFIYTNVASFDKFSTRQSAIARPRLHSPVCCDNFYDQIPQTSINFKGEMIRLLQQNQLRIWRFN